MKLKRLTRQGHSLSLIIDRPILEVLGFTEGTMLKMEIDKGRIILQAATDDEIKKNRRQPS